MGISTLAVQNKHYQRYKRTGSVETCEACEETHAVTITADRANGVCGFRCPNCGLMQEV